MNPSVLLIGATGLIGNAFLNFAVTQKSFNKITVIARRNIPSVNNNPLVEQHIIDFDNLSQYRDIILSDIIVCTIGTTIKKAGSQEAFRKVDYNIPLDLAEYAYQNGSKYFILISAIGADPASRIFYNRVKGEVERDIAKIRFNGVHILRPSLLIGNRNEFRLGENIGQIFAPLYSPFLPDKYKPVKAEILAEKIYSICLNPPDGIHIYEGLNEFLNTDI